MVRTTLMHIKIDADIKKDMQKLIDLGFFSTDAEIARGAIRNLVLDIKEHGKI